VVLGLGALLAWLLVGGVAGAEHEVYYRYSVLGYVKDARGQPLADRSVELVRDRTGYTYAARTDAQGLFILVARLGDESAGERLTLHVGRLTRSLTARFDPANHTDERGTRLDLQGTRFVERPGWFHRTLARVRETAAR
jgi:hypothetical protein